MFYLFYLHYSLGVFLFDQKLHVVPNVVGFILVMIGVVCIIFSERFDIESSTHLGMTVYPQSTYRNMEEDEGETLHSPLEEQFSTSPMEV
jgi:hypothetical protein